MRYHMRMNVRTNLLLPADLVAEVDELAGPRGRGRFVAEALREKLRRERLRRVVSETAGRLEAEAYPQWSTSDQVSMWVRALRAEGDDPSDASE
jgi:metal-responsive CopG/Arc/MetJ family transcriptional regulator